MVGLWCYNQSGVAELLIMRDPHYQVIMVVGFLNQLKHSESYILSCEKSLDLFHKNLGLLGLYPIYVIINNALSN